MIGRIRGILIEKQAPHIIVEAAGVGYELQAPISTFYQLPDLGKEVTLYTHLVIREDAQLLFAFMHKKEQALFRALIKISGVGPKLALAILSGMDPDTFVQCVMDNEIRTLERLPGIGRKTAERLLVEMRSRLKDWQTDIVTASGSRDAISALLSLGYKPQEANRAIAKYKDNNLSSEELIRLALCDMSKKV